MGEDNSILYLFGLSMQEKGKENRFLTLIRNHIKQKLEINIVLLHDAVIGASLKVKNNEMIEEMLNSSVQLYAVLADLKARGIKIEEVNPEINLIEYEGLVNLCIENSKIISWL